MKRIALLGLTLVTTTSVAAQQSIKPRPLGTAQASSKELLGSATLARSLPNGSVIVNDAVRRRLLLLDPTLQNYTVIADSTSGAANGYGQRAGALIPYVADSTLFLDVTAGSFLVIDPAGKVARVMSPPRPLDNGALASTINGFPGFDAKGRMVYRTNYPRGMQQFRDGSIQSTPAPDSAPIIRVDLDTRKADTIGAVKLARMITSSGTSPNGGTFTMNSQAPLSTIDDWALLSDGSIAILRGRDYHIDWILPDGTTKSTERISFDWKRLTDDDKLAVIDSITKARASGSGGVPGGAAGGSQMVMSFGGGDATRVMIGGGGGGGGGAPVGMQMREAAVAAAAPPTASSSTGGAAPQGKAADTKAADAKAATAVDGKAAAPDKNSAPAAANAAGAPSRDMAGSGRGAAMGMPAGMPGLPIPAASDLPDYLPPFTAASARADADANVWVRTTTPGLAPGNVVYDVINNTGELVDRVDVPRGMTIIGFGRGGIVYLTQRDPTGVRLIRASIH